MKIQLCLSGGGARGFAHLGVVQGLSELGFEIVRISGTSAGAIAGSFIAAGIDPQEVLEIFIRQQMFRLFGGAFNNGLLRFDGIDKLMRQYLPADLSDFKIPLIISATDILSGKTIYFTNGETVAVITGASSIPGLFRPVRYQQWVLVDGGVLNNLPVEPLKKFNLPVIGVHVNPVGEIPPPAGTISVLERTFHLGVYSNTLYRESLCDVLLEPSKLKTTKVFDYKKGKEIYEAGYQEVMHRADELLEKYL